jgi:hypothetical protein
LAAPAFAGLARMPGARGRITFDGQEFAIVEHRLDGNAGETPLPGAIAIAVARDAGLALVHDFSGLALGDCVLMLIPLVQFEKSAARSFAPEAEVLPADSSN